MRQIFRPVSELERSAERAPSLYGGAELVADLKADDRFLEIDQNNTDSWCTDRGYHLRTVLPEKRAPCSSYSPPPTYRRVSKPSRRAASPRFRELIEECQSGSA